MAAHPENFQRVTNRWSAVNLGGVERICGCSQVLVVLTVSTQTTSNCQGLSISLPPSPCLRTGKEIPAFMESEVSSPPPIVSLVDQRQNSHHNPPPLVPLSFCISQCMLWLERPQAVSLQPPRLYCPPWGVYE